MKTYIPIKKISQAFIAVGITTIVIFLVNFFFTREKIIVRKSTFNVGQISNQTIVAPFNFYIYEDPEVLKNKQVKAEERVLSKYQLSDDVTFDVQSHINEFYSLLDKAFVRDSLNSDLILNFDQDGYGFSEQELKFLENKDAREQLFEFLLVKVKSVLGVGILKSEPNNEKITLVEGNTEKVVSIKELFTKKTALNYILNQRTPRFRSDEWKSIIEKVLNNILQPNIIYDKDATGIAKKRASESVPPVLGEVLKNELIVQEHQKITGDMLRKLDALEQAEQQRTLTEQAGKQVLSHVAEFIYIFLVLSLFIILSYFMYPELLMTFSLFRTFLFFTACIALLLILITNLTTWSAYILPFGLPIILLAFLINVPAAIIFGFVNYFLVAGLLDWKIIPAMIICLSGMSAVLPLENPRSRRDFYNATFYMLIFFVGLVLIFGAIQHTKILEILNDIKWGVLGGLISLVGSMTLLAPIEQRLPVITNIHLLELSDFSNPLLKSLTEVASGTYHHCIIVGNLAETAAKAIGANPILSRVGSYYHDIGKTKNPEYFIENTTEEENIHNQLTPNQSAQVVKHHVEDGVKLAREHHIPKAIVDIIQQHHGTSQISFFMNEALKHEEKIDEKDFHYNGPKPQSKEAAIVMIADIVESTTKSLDEPTVEEIENAVKRSVKRLIDTDQLSESEISLRELKTLQQSMIPILLGIYQKRIAYPE
ncbi:MAG: HDIG domain-containing protein [Candidatus Celaenobacter antarcticus]|nr:HDIG domain-containing protein [Candidatus Celaenobacter antarcticus]MDP8314153.1 HDIG domain-containing protein [Candidatus Celaenobacter antarcticus]